jgi:hypothetical protein
MSFEDQLLPQHNSSDDEPIYTNSRTSRIKTIRISIITLVTVILLILVLCITIIVAKKKQPPSSLSVFTTTLVSHTIYTTSATKTTTDVIPPFIVPTGMLSTLGKKFFLLKLFVYNWILNNIYLIWII